MATRGVSSQGCREVCIYNLSKNYEDRNVLYTPCNSVHANECWTVEAFWAEEHHRIEVRHSQWIVPPIRPYSKHKKLYLCRHFWKCQNYRDNCNFAHSVRELIKWKQQSGKAGPASSTFPYLIEGAFLPDHNSDYPLFTSNSQEEDSNPESEYLGSSGDSSSDAEVSNTNRTYLLLVW